MGGKRQTNQMPVSFFLMLYGETRAVFFFFFGLLNFIFLIYALQCPGNNQHCNGATAHRKSPSLQLEQSEIYSKSCSFT